MIKLYTKNVCPKCMWTKSQLVEGKIEHEVINLDDPSNEEYANELREQGYLAAPVLELDGKRYSDHGEITRIIDGMIE